MQPAARVSAAIEILDRWRGGEPAEQALTRWGRANRYAGSKDRAAVRDHVFQALRCARSYAALGGGEDGRALMLGALRAEGLDPNETFSGVGHAPAPLSEAELAAARSPEAGAEAADMPDWLWPEIERSLEDAPREAALMRQRAEVFLRVNLRKTSVDAALAALAQESIEAEPHALSPTALKVTGGARKVKLSQAYADGLVELQDAASQAVVDMLPLTGAGRVLDYCAGGGGKSLAIAALSDAEIVAHDVAAERMKDIAPRAERAGAEIRICETEALGTEAPFDLVLCDAPCSGSGAWARAPEGKWMLTPERLESLRAAQSDALTKGSELVSAEGVLVYVTCSFLQAENEESVNDFLKRQDGWRLVAKQRWLPSDGGDGFFAAIIARN